MAEILTDFAQLSLLSHSFPEGSEAVHCYLCDHECTVVSETCCYCKETFIVGEEDIYPPRTAVVHEGGEKAEGGQGSSRSFHRFLDLPAELRIKIC